MPDLSTDAAPSKKPKRKPAPPASAALDEVWEVFTSIRFAAGLKGTVKLTPKTRSSIAARLKSYTVAELVVACRVVFNPDSHWLRGGFTAPRYVFRSVDQVTMLLEKAEALADDLEPWPRPAPPEPVDPAQLEAAAAEHRQRKLAELAAPPPEYQTPEQAAAELDRLERLEGGA